MKITGIHINDFQQFNDFHLDLTYPKGHDKEGKPLEKVCFIGQSGTGKTTLLNIIKKLLTGNFSTYSKDITYPDYHYLINCYWDFKFTIQNNFISSSNVLKSNEKQYENKLESLIKKIGLINFPADINIKHQFVNRKTTETFKKSQKIIDFEKQKLTPIWSKVYNEIKTFHEEEANFRIDLTKRAEVENINIKDEIKAWKRGSKNPLINLANKCLNPDNI